MALIIPTPGDIARDVSTAVRDTVEWSAATVGLIVSAPGRIDAMMTKAEAMMDNVGQVTDNAAKQVEKVGEVTDKAQVLLEVYEPILATAAPLAKEFVDEFSAEELQAAVHMVDELPVLSEHLRDEIIPLLHTLETVGPDIHRLVGLTSDVRKAVTALPGVRIFTRRRAEARSRDTLPRP